MSTVKEALRSEETQLNKGRTVAGIVNSIETLEGGGFLVRRPFPKASFSDFDPFLLLDEMGPMDVGPGEAKGELKKRIQSKKLKGHIARVETVDKMTDHEIAEHVRQLLGAGTK